MSHDVLLAKFARRGSKIAASAMIAANAVLLAESPTRMDDPPMPLLTVATNPRKTKLPLASFLPLW